MSNGWLTPDTAKQRSQEKLDELIKASSYSPVSNGIILNNPLVDGKIISDVGSAGAVQNARRNAGAVQFLASIGTRGVVEDYEETWYLVHDIEINGYLAQYGVLPWTHPSIGRLYTAYREALEDGNQPTSLPFRGKGGHEEPLDVGPLVKYKSTDQQVQECHFLTEYDFKTVSLAPTESNIEECREAQTEIGLKEIVLTLDLEQDDQIRGPLEGIFLLTGGPGVGKTTVALHRIPYLINEQCRSNDNHFGYDNTNDRFFTPDNQLVLVWKEHLVPYLRRCVKELVRSFPDENVYHIDKWISDCLRDYITFGPESWKKGRGEEWFEAFKGRLTEEVLKSFLDANSLCAERVARRLRGNLPKTTVITPGRIVPARPKRLVFTVGIPSLSITSYATLRNRLLKTFPQGNDLSSYYLENQQHEIRHLKQKVNDAFDDILEELTDFAAILFEFYASDQAKEALRLTDSAFDEELYDLALEEQRESRSLGMCDLVMLLWIIEMITHGSSETTRRRKGIARSSHILIDEAQYFDPRLLRLFERLVQTDSRNGVLTVVGDLEQKYSTHGVDEWRTLGLSIPDENRCQLSRNYRWTKEVFDFIETAHRRFEIIEPLNRPRHWRVDGGMKPRIIECSNSSDMIERISSAIAELRSKDKCRNWRIVVVTFSPDDMDAVKDLVENLESRGIPAGWKEDEDVIGNVIDKVVVTNIGSLVGLEFDAVFLWGVHLWNEDTLTADRKSGLWVALTRAKRFLFISKLSNDRLFSRDVFDEWFDE